jgi:uncharacterized SAM-binding protein YcdF (DUF218 family)
MPMVWYGRRLSRFERAYENAPLFAIRKAHEIAILWFCFFLLFFLSVFICVHLWLKGFLESVRASSPYSHAVSDAQSLF